MLKECVPSAIIAAPTTKRSLIVFSPSVICPVITSDAHGNHSPTKLLSYSPVRTIAPGKSLHVHFAYAVSGELRLGSLRYITELVKVPVFSGSPWVRLPKFTVVIGIVHSESEYRTPRWSFTRTVTVAGVVNIYLDTNAPATADTRTANRRKGVAVLVTVFVFIDK